MKEWIFLFECIIAATYSRMAFSKSFSWTFFFQKKKLPRHSKFPVKFWHHLTQFRPRDGYSVSPPLHGTTTQTLKQNQDCFPWKILSWFLHDLDPIVCLKPFFQGKGKLLRKLGPSFLPNLIFKSVQNFAKHVLQISLKPSIFILPPYY